MVATHGWRHLTNISSNSTRRGPTARWSLTDVENILRDLRKAVLPSLPANAHYRFVTDGRAGRLGEFKAFLDALKSVEGPDYLNNYEKRKFKSRVYRN